MQTPIDECLDTQQIADKMRMSVKSVQNHRLSEIKASCTYYKIGKSILVDPKDFNRYLIRNFRRSPNPIS